MYCYQDADLDNAKTSLDRICEKEASFCPDLKDQSKKLNFNYFYFYIINKTGGRLTEIQLIEIVFYHLIEIMLITWPNFTWPNDLTELPNLT